MPAAAVIPAPIAYIKVVAVKKLVVRVQFRTGGRGHRPVLRLCQDPNGAPGNGSGVGSTGVLLTECPGRPAGSP